METENKKSNKGNFFKIMYRTRMKVKRGDMTIVNLSLLFSIVALLTAPWLVILGVLVALILGYQINIDRSGTGFENSFEEVVENSKRNVQKVFGEDEE